MYFFRCVDAMSCKQCNIFFIYQMRDCIGSIFQIQQAAAFCFLYPFIRIVIAVKDNPFVFNNDITNYFFGFCHNIFGTFQLIGNIADGISSDGIHNRIGIRNRRRRAQHTEFKFIAGKSKRRCTVTVTGIFLEAWHCRYAGFHPLTGYRYIFQPVFVRFQNIA